MSTLAEPLNAGGAMTRVPDGMHELAAENWEGCSPADLAHYWRLPAVHLFTRVGSTNDVARRLAQSGVAAGTLVIAEEQVTGRGRGAHSWSSPPGVGLWCSLILRDVPSGAIGMLPIRVALAAAEALEPWTSDSIRVKWPNDLLLGGRKLAGILCEAFWDGHALEHIVVGFGLNVVQGREDFPEHLRGTATSLRMFTDGAVSRFAVASAVVAELRTLVFEPWPAPSDVVAAFSRRDALLGHDVEVREPETERVLLRGIASGIDEEGALLVRRADGSMLTVRAGTVRSLR